MVDECPHAHAHLFQDHRCYSSNPYQQTDKAKVQYVDVEDAEGSGNLEVCKCLDLNWTMVLEIKKHGGTDTFVLTVLSSSLIVQLQIFWFE